MCLRRAKSCPAISSARAISPASACRSAPCSAGWRASRRRNMQGLESLIGEAQRMLQICNACRYCEGYCAVFPAMERRLEFDPASLAYLSNLCHHCGACFYACQYAPPHEFAVNVPRVFAQIRRQSYEDYAWPRAFGSAYRRQGTVLSLATAAGLAIFFILAILLGGPQALTTKP